MKDDLVEAVARAIKDGFADKPFTPENIAIAAIAAARPAIRAQAFKEVLAAIDARIDTDPMNALFDEWNGALETLATDIKALMEKKDG
jgi:hypothetical protein